MCDIDRSIRQFVGRFGRPPDGSARAAGRVTVIGGHTDYNGGLVVTAPLSLGTAVSIGRNGRQTVRLVSDREPESVELPVGELATHPTSAWTRYALGVLRELGLGTRGLDVSVCSNLPMRRGLASSAALTAAVALAASRLTRAEVSPLDLALLCQRVEQAYVGVQCGLLDPYTALHATARDHLLLVDCTSQTHQDLVLPPELALVVCDSGADRQLAKTLYNARRAECEQVAHALGRPTLRGTCLADLELLRERLPIPVRRAEHVIREVERVERFCSALRDRDYASTKEVMADAHRSCRDLFECSHPSLDELVARAAAHPGCVGARLTGAGWGGATVNLVFRDQVREFCHTVAADRSWIAC